MKDSTTRSHFCRIQRPLENFQINPIYKIQFVWNYRFWCHQDCTVCCASLPNWKLIHLLDPRCIPHDSNCLSSFSPGVGKHISETWMKIETTGCSHDCISLVSYGFSGNLTYIAQMLDMGQFNALIRHQQLIWKKELMTDNIYYDISLRALPGSVSPDTKEYDKFCSHFEVCNLNVRIIKKLSQMWAASPEPLNFTRSECPWPCWFTCIHHYKFGKQSIRSVGVKADSVLAACLTASFARSAAASILFLPWTSSVGPYKRSIKSQFVVILRTRISETLSAWGQDLKIIISLRQDCADKIECSQANLQTVIIKSLIEALMILLPTKQIDAWVFRMQDSIRRSVTPLRCYFLLLDTKLKKFNAMPIALIDIKI